MNCISTYVASAFVAVVATASLSGLAVAQTPLKLIKPSTTGVPGEEIRVMRFDPQGNLWVAGRWPFWGECGLAMLPASELTNPPHPGGGFDTGKWTVWSNVEHPIPSPYIFDVEIASDGIIWIASEGGLTRFDRSASTPQDMWRTYTTANSQLIMNSVRSVALDGQGNVWLTNASVQSSNGAVFKFNPASNQWVKYVVGQQLPWSPPWLNVGAIQVGASGKVYVTHQTLGGFAEFNGTSWVLRSSSMVLNGILEDLQGNVWFTTSSSGLVKWNGTNFQTFNLGSQGTVTALGMDGQSGLVYAGSWYGDIFKMVNGTSAQFMLNADDIPGSIHLRPNGEMFINNYGGNGVLGTVRQYTAAGQLLRRINTFNSGLPDYFIDRIERDREGNLWFACGEGGISRMEGGDPSAPPRWRNWGNHNDNAEPYPWAGNEPMGGFYLDRNGTGWMGGNGIGRWDPATSTFTGFWNWQNNPGMGVTMFNSFAEDGAGNLFAATQYGAVMRFNGTQWVQQPPTAGGYTSDHPGVKSDPSDRVWSIGNLTAWMFDTNANMWVQVGQSWNLFNLGGATSYDFGPDGTLWIGTNNGLLRVSDPPNGAFTVFTIANSPLPAKQVRGVAVRDDGAIGLSSHEFGAVTPFPNGVAFIRGDISIASNWTIWQYGTSAMPHYQLGDVEFDAQGDLWVSAISEGVVEIAVGGPVAIPGDINADGVVNVADLLAIVNAWGPCPAPPAPCPADVNGDGVVSVNDLLIIISNWS